MPSNRERAHKWVREQPWFGMMTRSGSHGVLADSLTAEFAAKGAEARREALEQALAAFDANGWTHACIRAGVGADEDLRCEVLAAIRALMEQTT